VLETIVFTTLRKGEEFMLSSIKLRSIREREREREESRVESIKHDLYKQTLENSATLPPFNTENSPMPATEKKVAAGSVKKKVRNNHL
jgi:hypothetical protein